MSALCSTCSDLTFEKLLNSDVVFHKSLQALVRSAENSGCAFCKLCWAQIQSNCDPDAVDLCLIVSEPSSPGGGDGGAQHITPMTDFRVYLTALWNPPGENSATVIELSCGKSRSAGNELSTTLYVFADPGWCSSSTTLTMRWRIETHNWA